MIKTHWFLLRIDMYNFCRIEKNIFIQRKIFPNDKKTSIYKEKWHIFLLRLSIYLEKIIFSIFNKFQKCVMLFDFRFPDWFNKSLAIILFVVCFSLSLYRHRIVSPIHMLIIVLIGLTFFWHVLLFLLQPGPELKTICERIGTFENFLSYTLCKWSDPLWWALLRDGPYFIMVLYSTVSLQFPLLPSSLIAAPFDDRQLTPSPILNRRRQQRTRERRRSPFVIHYILLRTGHIRRRRR
jgi:hypothetical protein